MGLASTILGLLGFAAALQRRNPAVGLRQPAACFLLYVSEFLQHSAFGLPGMVLSKTCEASASKVAKEASAGLENESALLGCSFPVMVVARSCSW